MGSAACVGGALVTRAGASAGRSLRGFAMVLALGAGHALAGYPGSMGDLVYASGFERPAMATGGSNYHWYRVADCDREPYGLLASYHQTIPGESGSVRALAQQQLAAIRASGQERLSLGVYFAHGISTGTLVDSSNPTAVAQAAANLADLLVDVQAAGLVEVLFRFFPVGVINPSSSNFVPQLVDEYWGLIATLRPVLLASGLAYSIDLMVEGAPRDSGLPIGEPWKYPANADWSRAVRDLWQRYFAAWGSADTVGFSFLTDASSNRMRQRVRHMRYVYEGNYPERFAADFYGTEAVPESDRLIALHDALMREDPWGSLGWRDSEWILAEAYYDDPLAAADLASAISATGRRVAFLTQWPWDRADLSCGPNPAVNVAPPVAWTAWGGYGF